MWRGGLARVWALVLLVGGFSCKDEEADGPDEDDPRFACQFETRLIDSCNNPEGSPWTPGCIDVLSDDDCTVATQESSEMVGDCQFTTTYQNVVTTPGMTCPEEGTGTGPAPVEGRAPGEECSSLQDCASGLCVARFYCTVSCSASADCEADFPAGCCVSEGSLGYCINTDDCAALCPENSSPVGLPTVCECDTGFMWNMEFTACIPE